MKRKRHILLFIITVLCLLPVVLTSCKRQEAAQETQPVSDSYVNSQQESAAQTAAAPGFEVHFIDVGQGDAALVICDGEAMLIDGGSSAKSSLIYTYLREHNIDHLKYIVATHNDEDHIGGLAGALNFAEAEYALCISPDYEGSKTFDSFKKYLGNAELIASEAGMEFSLGSAKGRVLGPVDEAEASNNNSIIIRLEYGNTAFLFTGDAEALEEESVLASRADLSADVLKVAHHGSNTSTTEDFLRAVSPSYAVISCGMSNEYHHPADSTLERLHQADVQLYRTDLQGTVIARSDGKTVTFEVQKNADISTYLTYDELNPPARSAQEIPYTDGASGGENIYILNTNSKVIHIPSCESVSKMSEKNRLEISGTLEEILAEYPEYRPCNFCHAQY